MSLYATWTRLCDDIDVHISHFNLFFASRPVVSSAKDFGVADECLLEGHLSRIWQAWGAFCRSCVCQSCIGVVDGNGAPVAPHPSAASEDHVSSAVIRAKKNAHPFWGSSNTILRLEPTWGDTDVLVTVIPRIQPSNQGQLLAAFSQAHRSAKTLQTIRNAAAHHNFQTLAEVKLFQSNYLSFPITHPVQALGWVEPSSSDFLVIHVLEELREAALIAIS
jgi:hypothetical protein